MLDMMNAVALSAFATRLFTERDLLKLYND